MQGKERRDGRAEKFFLLGIDPLEQRLGINSRRLKGVMEGPEVLLKILGKSRGEAGVGEDTEYLQ